MATLAQLEKALVNADKAGDMDAARKLAAVVKAERARMGDTINIPGSTEFGDVPGTVPEQAPSSIGDKIMGLPDAALSMATSIPATVVGGAAGMVKGISDQIRTGGNANPDDAMATADKVAGALSYAPHTQTGGKILEGVGKVMEPLAALGPMATELGVVGETANAVKPVARAAVAEAVAPIKQAATALTEKVTSEITGVKPRPTASGISGAVDSDATVELPYGAGKDAGAAAVDVAMQRQNVANELPVPIKLTEGQKTRAFDQQRFERETAKQADIGEPIRQRFQEQNLQLQQNMDSFIDDTGAELTEPRDVGGIVDKALRQRAARDKTKIRALYKDAEKAGEMTEPVSTTPIHQLLNDSASAETLAPVIGATRKELERLGSLNGGDGSTLTLGNAESLRKFVTKVAGSDKTNMMYANEIKSAIDNATEGKGGELYKKARAAYAQSMSDYENFGLAKNLLKSKRGSTDRAIALEDVLHKSVISPSTSMDSVAKLKNLLQTEGETGQQAWKELQGGTLRHIKNEALKGVTRDAAGNQVVSAAALDKAVTQLDKSGKLDLVLGKKKAEQIRTINDVAKDVLTVPPGAVNTSNTATVLAGLMDVAISGTTGIPVPVMTAINQVTSRIKNAKLRARVKQSLGE